MNTATRPAIDISKLPDFHRAQPWASLQAWAIQNEPRANMLYKDGFWSQIMFVRDELSNIFRDRVQKITVASTHRSKSIDLPVFEVLLTDGTRMYMRDNMHDWKVSVDSPTPIVVMPKVFSGEGKEEISVIYCEGFSSDMVYGSYAASRKKFTVEIHNDRLMYTFLFMMANQG